MLGTAGADRVSGTRKRDVIVTLGGDDHVENLRRFDVLCSGTGDDVVTDAVWPAQLSLGAGHDRVEGRGVDEVYAGNGNDRITLRRGGGIAVLGPGDDMFLVLNPDRRGDPFTSTCVSFAHSAAPVRVDLTAGRASGQGRDRMTGVRCVTTSRFSDSVVGTVYDDSVTAGAGLDVVEAGDGDDQVAGNDHADRLVLGEGDDYGSGGGGWDRIYGGGGDDDLEGWGDGDYLDGGPGNDHVFAALLCAHGLNSLDTDGLWDSAANELFGGPGDDYLVGDKGNDRLGGGPGDDYGLGGYRDRRVDWVTSIERPLQRCLEGVYLR